MIDNQLLSSGRAFLAEHGLNRFACLDCAALPPETAAYLHQADIPLGRYQRLILIGHGGQTLWRVLQTHGLNGTDPIDQFSEQITRQFIHDYLPDSDSFWLFPSGLPIPLQQLGTLAGWGHDSPLGLGISTEFGLWYAYRAAFLTTADLPIITEPVQPSPCDSCVDKPCIHHCPVSAVSTVGNFDIPTCAHHRLSADSPCVDRCLSRLACPVASEHRYTPEQIQYHYNLSRSTLRNWFA